MCPGRHFSIHRARRRRWQRGGLEPLETVRGMLAADRGASACHTAHVAMVIGVGIPTCVVPGVAAKILYRAASGTLAWR
jgi:hypothetical protein